MQRVVLDRLPVGAVCDWPHLAVLDDEARMPPPPVVAAVAQIVVGRQVIP
jgi:hypothetical protein